MSKNFYLVLAGALAVIAGAVVTVVLLKDKFKKDEEIEFDDFDYMDDEELEHFFGPIEDAEDEDDELPSIVEDRDNIL